MRRGFGSACKYVIKQIGSRLLVKLNFRLFNKLTVFRSDLMIILCVRIVLNTKEMKLLKDDYFPNSSGDMAIAKMQKKSGSLP